MKDIKQYKEIKLKVFNKKLFTVNGRSLLELEDDLKSICSIISIPFTNDNDYFNFKCLSASLLKEGYDYFILYTVKIQKGIWKLKVDISEPCTYTCFLPWYVLDDHKWVKIIPIEPREDEYPDLKNPIQEDIGILKTIFLKLQNYMIWNKFIWARFDLKEE